MQTSPPSTDLPQHFTDATRAILVDWLIQVHVSCLYFLSCSHILVVTYFNMRFFDPMASLVSAPFHVLLLQV